MVVVVCGPPVFLEECGIGLSDPWRCCRRCDERRVAPSHDARTAASRWPTFQPCQSPMAPMLLSRIRSASPTCFQYTDGLPPRFSTAAYRRLGVEQHRAQASHRVWVVELVPSVNIAIHKLRQNCRSWCEGDALLVYPRLTLDGERCRFQTWPPFPG